MTDNKAKIPEKAKVKENKPYAGRGYRLNLIISILLLAAFICLVFYTKQFIQEQVNTLNKKINELSVKQQSQTAESVQSIENLMAAKEEKFKKISKHINKALKDSPYKTNDWLMQKARYYLELAKINNTWTNDYQTTQNLLAGADDTLKSINSDDIVDIRKQIASEELSVAAANKLDTTKLLTELHAISKVVDDLKVEKPKTSKQEVANNEGTTTPSTWQEHFKASLAKLNQLIIIRRTSETPVQNLAPNYMATIRANLKLNIQQMQWAIVSRNQDIFNLSCQQATANIKAAFNTEDPQVKVIIEKLENMQDTDLSLTKAKLGSALNALEKLISDNDSVDEG